MTPGYVVTRSEYPNAVMLAANGDFAKPADAAILPSRFQLAVSSVQQFSHYWNLVRDLQKKDAEAAKSLRDYSNSATRQITADRLAQGSSFSAKVRSVL
jgi:hypothetical protein